MAADWFDKKASEGKINRFRVNVLHEGKERWKYCKSVKRARVLQECSIAKGLSSLIFQKKEGKYIEL